MVGQHWMVSQLVENREGDSGERKRRARPRSCLSKTGQQMVNDYFNQLPRIRCTLRNSEQATLVNVIKKQNGISQFNLNNITIRKIIDIRLRITVQPQNVVYTLNCPSRQLPIESSCISLFSPKAYMIKTRGIFLLDSLRFVLHLESIYTLT
jgi:hypothetical protein